MKQVPFISRVAKHLAKLQGDKCSLKNGRNVADLEGNDILFICSFLHSFFNVHGAPFTKHFFACQALLLLCGAQA